MSCTVTFSRHVFGSANMSCNDLLKEMESLNPDLRRKSFLKDVRIERRFNFLSVTVENFPLVDASKLYASLYCKTHSKNLIEEEKCKALRREFFSSFYTLRY